MSNDTEAAWPLTPTQGYQPAPTLTNAAEAMPPVPTPYPVAPMMPPASIAPTHTRRTSSTGPVIAKLGIILGTAIPLSAIAAQTHGSFGLLIAWIGIAIVAFIALGLNRN